jgi:hypothetical protein
MSDFTEIGAQLVGKIIKAVVADWKGTSIVFTDGTVLEMPNDAGHRCGYQFGLVESA